MAYKNSWVTDLEITEETISTIVSSGRYHLKHENELFNVMKNHGYYMERNYSYGQKNLAFNFYLLMLLVFFISSNCRINRQAVPSLSKTIGQ